MTSNESIHLLKPFTRHNKIIIYGGNKYSIDFDLFKHFSNYFYRLQNYYEMVDEIEIPEEPIDISEESFKSFIASCQNEKFELNESNAFSLHQLSIKYDIPQLNEITTNYIKEHDKLLILKAVQYKFLLMKENETKQEEAKFLINFDDEENTIVTDLFEFIGTEEFLELPLEFIHRIISSDKLSIKQMNETQINELVDFLFKCLDKYKTEASILFSNFDTDYNIVEIYRRLINDYSDVIDISKINPVFIIKASSEILKERPNTNSNLDVIPKDKPNEQPMQNESDNNDHSLQLKKMVISEFNVLPLKSKLEISEKILNTTDFHCKSFFAKINRISVYLQRFESDIGSGIEIIIDKDDKKLIDIKDEEEKEYQVQLQHQTTEVLFNTKSLKTPEFIQILSTFFDFRIEVKYPQMSFKELFDQVLSIENTMENRIKISIFISGSNKIEIFLNKFISYIRIDETVSEIYKEESKDVFYDYSSLKQILIPSSIKVIGNYAFENFSSLTEILIPSSVTTIEKSAFSKCSSLTQITIPSSVTSIGDLLSMDAHH